MPKPAAAGVADALSRIDEACAQASLPVANVEEVYGVTMPASEGGTGQAVLVLVCEPKPKTPWQPKLKPDFAFFEQFVGTDKLMDEQDRELSQ